MKAGRHMEIKLSRRIDALGRVLFPKELRQKLGWKIGDVVALTYTGETANTLVRTQQSGSAAFVKLQRNCECNILTHKKVVC